MARIGSADRYAIGHPQLGSPRDLPVAVVTAAKAAAAESGLLIDVGSGEGGTLHAMRSRLGTDALLVGFDVSLVRCTIAHGRGLRAVVADALTLPLSSGSVAFACCRHVIEHVSDDTWLLEEVRRVLRPGALLYLETPLRLPGAWYPYRNESGDWVLDPTHVREYGHATDVEALLTHAGLTPVRWNTRPIRYPVSDLLRRVIGSVGLPAIAAGPHLTRGVTVRIPRYREIQVLARS